MIRRHTTEVSKFVIPQRADASWMRGRILHVGGVAICVLLSCRHLSAQQALRSSVAGEASSEAQHLQAEGLPYTVKSGDFRLLLSPAFSATWNDNINLSKDNVRDDFILNPSLGIDASYPLTDRNLLLLNLNVGYDDYLRTPSLSRVDLRSGSQLSFDIYVGDFKINLHDRISYTQDAATAPEVSNTGSYGTFNNSAGFLTIWDLRDVTLNLGYDHLNTLTTSSQFNYTDNATESVLARAGLNVHPRLTVGFEGTISYTAYAQKVLNSNIGYSGGIYGDFQPGPYFHFQPRVGYALYHYEQTSLTVPAIDQTSWYFDLTVSHQATRFLTYSLSAGHEITPGLQSDTTQDWYARPNITLQFIKDVSLSTSLFYEHGNLGGGSLPGTTEEVFDWYGGSLNLGYAMMKNLNANLNYRFTMRSSNVSTGEYTQNEVGLSLVYALQ